MTTKEQRAEWLRLEQEATGKRAGAVPVLSLFAAWDALRPLCEHVEALEAELARLRRLEAAVLENDAALEADWSPAYLGRIRASQEEQRVAIAEARAARKP